METNVIGMMAIAKTLQLIALLMLTVVQMVIMTVIKM
jgi:hypothetical protein